MSDNEENKVCHTCIGEKYLASLIEREGEVGACDYCGDDEEACVTLEALSDHIEGAFERHYHRTSDQPDAYEDMLLRDRESNYEWDRHGEPVSYAIQDAASISENIAQDVLEILEERHSDFEAAAIGEECEFASDSCYEEKTINDHEFAFEWQAIERSLKSETRFFNPSAETFLDRLFANLDGRMTRDGEPVVAAGGPGTKYASFFRARVIHSTKEFEEAMMRPDLRLGPPPAWAARAGRMNAHGISVFYGATDKGVALAEVRPPVGSRALVAEFKIMRAVKLLDVTALESVFVEGSIFDPSYLEQLSGAKFLKRLSSRMTMPVMPDDEPTEYLITQMIADYLSRRPTPGLDGIIFRSVQSPGDPRNVVLFHHASRVENLELPEGTKLSSMQSSSTEDGPEPDYHVWEEVPPATETDEAGDDNDDDAFSFPQWPDLFDPDADVREITLRVATDSVSAHHVEAVTFVTSDFNVSRTRMERRLRKYSTRSSRITRDDL